MFNDCYRLINVNYCTQLILFLCASMLAARQHENYHGYGVSKFRTRESNFTAIVLAFMQRLRLTRHQIEECLHTTESLVFYSLNYATAMLDT